MAAVGGTPLAHGAVPALRFAVLDAAPVEHAAAPALRLALEIGSAGVPDIRSMLLDVQVAIAARRRRYGQEDHERLFELFGPAAGWSASLRSLLWTRRTLVVPPFRERVVVDLDIPCTYDLEVAATRYFDALPDGEVPLELVFSGAVFYDDGGRLQTVRIPWDLEAEYRLPVAVWKATMERHFPGAAWLRLSREAFDRLRAHRSRIAAPSWDAAIDDLLDGREGG